ncbi:Transglutaminase-like superfamily protein [Tessaracoccus flavus]|nr:Transglutaminase-like superfamily protein [Tessaracoccus flavus]
MAVTSRHVSSTLIVDVRQPADLVFSVAVSSEYPEVRETLSFRVGDEDVAVEEVVAPSGSRLHRLRETPVGSLTVDYTAAVHGRSPEPPLLGIDEILYTRPSRYCDSDRLANLAHAHFEGLTGRELVRAVTDWVSTNIAYRPGSSRVVDGALETYLDRAGVCRDYAHLVVALLRGRNVPARMASVYAPGLKPMDFHAVAEVFLEGRWHVIDATGLAPRQSMVRICTGRDAADTAFMTTLGGRTVLTSMTVNAWVDGDLPVDDRSEPATLS